MSVLVRAADGPKAIHHDATGWHVDDYGRLHVRSDTGPLATYAQGFWVSVSIPLLVEPTAQTDDR